MKLLRRKLAAAARRVRAALSMTPVVQEMFAAIAESLTDESLDTRVQTPAGMLRSAPRASVWIEEPLILDVTDGAATLTGVMLVDTGAQVWTLQGTHLVVTCDALDALVEAGMAASVALECHYGTATSVTWTINSIVERRVALR